MYFGKQQIESSHTPGVVLTSRNRGGGEFFGVCLEYRQLQASALFPLITLIQLLLVSLAALVDATASLYLWLTRRDSALPLAWCGLVLLAMLAVIAVAELVKREVLQ